MTERPAGMAFVTMAGPGGPEVLTLAEGPTPAPGSGEVLVRVAAAGVNRPDVLQRRGGYPPPPGASPILGLEIAGEIVALGPEVERWRVGDRVSALVAGGGYAEYCVAPGPQCLPAPKALDLAVSAALPETVFTVWANVFQRGRLMAGETLLVHGGTSGIGTTAIQLARAFGATVITTVGSEEKRAACAALGAQAINYRTHDFVAEVARITEGRGADVILDMVGGEYFARNVKSLAVEGRLVQIAFLEGAKVPLDLQPIMTRRLTVTGSTLRPRTVAQKAVIAAEVEAKVWPLVEAGLVRPLIHARFPLARAAEAHALMESSAHIGKILLDVA